MSEDKASRRTILPTDRRQSTNSSLKELAAQRYRASLHDGLRTRIYSCCVVYALYTVIPFSFHCVIFPCGHLHFLITLLYLELFTSIAWNTQSINSRSQLLLDSPHILRVGSPSIKKDGKCGICTSKFNPAQSKICSINLA
jgi:hypothetical protein